MSSERKHNPITEEVAELIKILLLREWRLVPMYPDNNIENLVSVLPPLGDVRNHWCAKWTFYNGNIMIPHWAWGELDK